MYVYAVRLLDAEATVVSATAKEVCVQDVPDKQTILSQPRGSTYHEIRNRLGNKSCQRHCLDVGGGLWSVRVREEKQVRTRTSSEGTLARGRFVFATTRLDTNCLEAMIGWREAQWQDDDISLAREDQERRIGWKPHTSKRTQQQQNTQELPNTCHLETNERGQKTKVQRCRLDCSAHARPGGGVVDVHAANIPPPGQQRPAR